MSCAQQANTAPIWWQMSRISPRTCHLLVKRDKLARLEQFLELAGGLLKVFMGDVHPPGVAICPPGVAVCKYVPGLSASQATSAKPGYRCESRTKLFPASLKSCERREGSPFLM